MTNGLKFNVIKCEDGLYINKQRNSYSTEHINTEFEQFNGHENDIVPMWKDGWYLLKGETDLTSYQVKRSGERANFRWELIDKEDNPLNLPDVIAQENADEIYDDYEYHIGSKCVYSKYSSLYKRVYDTLADTWKDADCEVVQRGTLSVSDVNNFQSMKVSLHGESQCYGKNEQLNVELSNIVSYADIEEMITPPLAMHNRPCQLTSHQTYRIIRSYVKEHIDHTYGIITSDYDFCFTVKKRIPIKPYVITREITKDNGRSYKRPKFSHSDVTYKTWDLFEMTHADSRYKGYTVIRGFTGNSLADLVDNIKSFLDELMDRINAPVTECEHCGGYGHIYPNNAHK